MLIDSASVAALSALLFPSRQAGRQSRAVYVGHSSAYICMCKDGAASVAVLGQLAVQG